MHFNIKLLCLQSVEEKLYINDTKFADLGRRSNHRGVGMQSGLSLTFTLCQQLLFIPLKFQCSISLGYTLQALSTYEHKHNMLYTGDFYSFNLNHLKHIIDSRVPRFIVNALQLTTTTLLYNASNTSIL